MQLDLLWHVSKFTSNVALETRPGWSGYMTDVSKGDYPGHSIVQMLPIIDLDPTDNYVLHLFNTALCDHIRSTIIAESHGDCQSPSLEGILHPLENSIR